MHGEVGDGAAFFFKRLASVEDGFVFNLGGDDVFRFFLGTACCAGTGTAADDAEDGVVVGFRPAAGEDDFLRASADERRDLFTSRFHSGPGALAGGVDGGSVSELTGQIGEHGLQNFRLDGSGGVVIEVNAGHGSGLQNNALPRKSKWHATGTACPPEPREHGSAGPG